MDLAASVLRAGIRTRLSGELARNRGFTTWARSLWLEGQRLGFERFPWMEAVYQDAHPAIVVRKCTQVGFTVWAVLRCFYNLTTVYRAVLYFFPTDNDVRAFVQGRVNPIISGNEDLRGLVRGLNNVSVKRVGPGHIYFRGMRSPSARKSTNADCLVLDEVDHMDVLACREAEARLQASLVKHTIHLGNPSFPAYGISAAYDESDRRMWHLRCPGCSLWACPDLAFPEKQGDAVRCIGRDATGRHYLTCERCGAELDPRGDGRWIPMMLGNGRRHGYTCSQLVRPDADLGKLLTEFQTTRLLGTFCNLELGRPYIDSTNRVTAAEVLALCSTWTIPYDDPGPCTMGIDTGKDFHWVVSRWTLGRGRRLVWFGRAADYAEIDDVIRRYHVRRFVIDGMPEVHSTRKWVRERHAGRGFSCFFSENQRGTAAWNEETRQVVVNRTEALDVSRNIIRGRLLKDGGREPLVELPIAGPLVEEFAAHYQADAKRLVEDEVTGSHRYEYIRLHPEDHWSLAATYDCLCWSDSEGPPVLGVSTDRGAPVVSGGEGNVLDWRF